MTGFEKELKKGYATASFSVLELEQESVIRIDKLKIVVAGTGSVSR